jgi:membrane protein DedA with SNARE-associated domain
MDWITHLFEQNGYWVLFSGLFTESLALPFPGELAMAFSGHMVYLGKFNLVLVLLCAFLGATLGTTITYFLGKKLGLPFFEKYGKFFFMHPKTLLKLKNWFGKYGNKILLVSYFIPGMRHFTGYSSGILGVRLRTFLIFNHLGAFLWIFTYVMLGKIFGGQLEQVVHLISAYFVKIVLCIILGLVLVFLLKWLHRITKPKKINKENDIISKNAFLIK